MKRLSPNFLSFLPAIILIFMMLLWLDVADLVHFPKAFYKWYLAILGLLFLWWPFDMLIHWEKRTPASIAKDKYIAMMACAVICFVVPYYFWLTPFYPTLGISVLISIVIPGLWIIFRYLRSKIVTVNSSHIYQIAMKSDRAQEFMNYFPGAHQYITGLTPGEGERSYLWLHHRKACDALEESWIDYVLSVAVDRRLGIHIGGKEQLDCYLFKNDGRNCGVGFLPSSNIGRALDYGFSQDEMENAIAEARTLSHRWKALGDEPLTIRHYPGRYVKIR